MGESATLQTLVERHLITEAELQRARAVADGTASRLMAVLVRLGMVAEDALADIQAECFALPRLHPDGAQKLTRDVPLNRRFCQAHALAVLAGDNGPILVMADPGDEQALAAMHFALGEQTQKCVATFSDIETLHADIDPEPGTAPVDPADEGEALRDDLERVLDQSSDAPVIRLVNRLVSDAVTRGASDIHIEPMNRLVKIRWRVDGRLVDAKALPASWAAPLVSRLKIMARLDIAEKRLPQDGRIRFGVKGRDVDIRVATSPTSHGEGVVLRLLGRETVPLELEGLGLAPQALARFEAALRRPHGIILLTGPTGSGKTTTLYAALNRLNRPDTKILTVEDPVEYQIKGVCQVQVRPDIGLSYGAALRAFLRQDPDVLMIGEIRDAETAGIAMRAALTGHLVLSTLHTNTALGAFTRLADMGLERYLIASTVVLAAAQRLVRRLCPHCKSAHAPTPQEASLFASTGLEEPTAIWEAAGCPSCHHAGYVGRIPLVEVVAVDEGLRQMVREAAPEAVMVEQALAAQDSLLGHGLQRVAQGETTLDEVRRAVAIDA